MIAGAVADAGSRPRWAIEPLEKLGSPSAGPLNPDSRLGRKASPFAQGRVKMDAIVVGIDVSKDKLDIAVHPGGEAFSTSRDAAGLDAVMARLAPLSPIAVAVEATGGVETVVAASLAAGLPVVVVNPAQVRAFANALASADRSDRRHGDCSLCRSN